jgi:hypothetical protein
LMNTRKCPSCGYLASNTALRCLHCDRSLDDVPLAPPETASDPIRIRGAADDRRSVAEQSGELRCPRCASLVSATAIRCLKCNYPLDQPPPAPEGEVHFIERCPLPPAAPQPGTSTLPVGAWEYQEWEIPLSLIDTPDNESGHVSFLRKYNGIILVALQTAGARGWRPDERTDWNAVETSGRVIDSTQLIDKLERGVEVLDNVGRALMPGPAPIFYRRGRRRYVSVTIRFRRLVQ